MIRIFLYRGYKLRIEDRNGEPWLFVVDICKITGLYDGRTKSYDAILRSIP